MTRRNLTVELRPRRLSELIGQDRLVQDLRNNLNDKVPIGILLGGSFGAGKTTIARILAVSFQCTHQEQFGEPCDECLENEDMFNISERNCAELRTIDAMREFLPTLLSYPNFGRYRVIILDEAQQITKDAQQTLLKPFEDKDSVNIFIICTSEPTKINGAIKDRCVPFAVPELKPKGVETLVQNTMKLALERFGMESREPEPLIKVLHTAQMTSSRNIVMAVDQYLSGSAPEQAIVIKEAGEVDYYTLFRFVSQGDWNSAREILKQAKPTDAIEIKTRMSGYFRNKLVETAPGQRADLLSMFIREMVDNNVDEYGLQLSGVVASIYKICRIVTDIKNRGTNTLVPVGDPVPAFTVQ
jgi:DNA polymerase III gamma/tau subunit